MRLAVSFLNSGGGAIVYGVHQRELRGVRLDRKAREKLQGLFMDLCAALQPGTSPLGCSGTHLVPLQGATDFYCVVAWFRDPGQSSHPSKRWFTDPDDVRDECTYLWRDEALLRTTVTDAPPPARLWVRSDRAEVCGVYERVAQPLTTVPHGVVPAL